MPSPPQAIPPIPAPLWRRLAAAMYECALLFAVFFIFAYAFLALTRSTFPLPHPTSDIFSAYVMVVFGAYFGYFWTRSGQTLAMKTWDIRVVNRAGQRLGWPMAIARYLLGWAALIMLAALVTFGLMNFAEGQARAQTALLYPLVLVLLIALAYGLARIDPQRRFVHDRFLGTQVLAVVPPNKKKA
jgi:uncharacterized RDD family membrane protein YckC